MKSVKLAEMTQIKSSREKGSLYWTLITKTLPTFIYTALVYSVDGMNASGKNGTLKVYSRKQANQNSTNLI